MHEQHQHGNRNSSTTHTCDPDRKRNKESEGEDHLIVPKYGCRIRACVRPSGPNEGSQDQAAATCRAGSRCSYILVRTAEESGCCSASGTPTRRGRSNRQGG